MSRTFVALVAAAAVVTVAGCDLGQRTAGPHATPSATASPSPSGPPPITEIPATVLLQAEDLGPEGYVATDAWFSPQLNPCGGTSVQADGRQAKRVWMVGVFKQPRRGDLTHVVTSYKDGSAVTYLEQIRESITRCAQYTEQIDPIESANFDGTVHHEVSLVAEGFAGDDSVMFSHNRWEVHLGVAWHYTNLVGIVRLGSLVVALEVNGSEGIREDLRTDRADMDRFMLAAMNRVTAAFPNI